MDLEISQLLKEKKTLAVQVRGVEWGDVKGHPIPPSLEVYVEEIDKAINQCDFEQIFLATDSDETVEFISNKYPGKVVVYSDVARAPKGSKTLAIFDTSIIASIYSSIVIPYHSPVSSNKQPISLCIQLPCKKRL